MAAQPSEFTLDSVRDFIVERGGRVTNHQLVKHFKYFLTEPHTKEYARLQFKEFVNTLATIQQQPAEEGGEKFLVLKAKFLPTPPQAAMMMQFQHHQPPPPPTLLTNTNYMQQPHLAPMMMRAPPPYRPPPEPRRSSTNSLSASPVSAANGSSPFQFNHQPSPPPPPLSYQQQQGHRLPPPPPPSNSNSNLHQQQQQFAPLMNRQASVGSIGDFIPASVYLSASVQDLTSSSSSSSLSQLNGAPVVPPRGRLRSSSHSNENNKENNNGSDMTTSSSLGSLTGSAGGGGSIDGGIGGAAASGVGGEVKISVKERTQRFNKMASEVDLLGIGVGGKGTLTDAGDHQQLHNNRHKAKAGGVGDEDDTSSVGTVEPRAREWMLATARGDYHAIARILRDEPRLARRRDFVTGYTGLHWAAKHGNDALVKMLAGTYKADVNARTNAGCSPLHIAALQGHDDVYDLLVKTYGADSNLRDYSGKKAYQYLKRADCTFSISSDTFRSEFTSSSYSSSSSCSSSSATSAASKAAGGGGFDRGSGLYSSLRNMKFHMKIPSTSSSSHNKSGGSGEVVATSSADSVLGSGGDGDRHDGSACTYSSYSNSSSAAAVGVGEPLSKRRPPSVHSSTGGGVSGSGSGSTSTAFLRDVRSGSARRRANSASAFVNHTT